MAKAAKESNWKTVRVPLIGAIRWQGTYPTTTTQPYSATNVKGQFIEGYVPQVVESEITGKKKIILKVRRGWREDTSHSPNVTGYHGTCVYIDNFDVCAEAPQAYTSYDNGTFYKGTVLAGNTSASNDITAINPAVIPSISTGSTLLITEASSNRYYFPSAVNVNDLAFTGDISSGSAVVQNIAGLTKICGGASTALIEMHPGQIIAGTGIPVGTRILSVDSATQITMNANATATTATLAMTHEGIARFIDTNFPSNPVGDMVELDGYLFILDADGNIRNSDLNAPHTWSAVNTIPRSAYSDLPVTLIRWKNYIVACGNQTMEFFVNAGTADGSPLRRIPEMLIHFGVLRSGSNLLTRPIVFLDRLFWTSSLEGAGYSGVWMLEQPGGKPVKLSPAELDPVFSYSLIYGFMSDGQAYLYWRADRDDSYPHTFLYSFETKEWTVSGWPGLLFLASGMSSVHAVSETYTRGELYRLSGTLGQDDQIIDGSDAVVSTIQTNPLDFDTDKNKRIHKIKLIGEQVTSQTANIQWTTDDYITWSTAQSVELDGDDDGGSLYALGVGRRWAFRIEQTSMAGKLEALNITYSECER